MEQPNIGLIGYGFTGKAHSFGYTSLPLIYGPEYRVNRKIICGRNAQQVRYAADKYGWEECETDWHTVKTKNI